MAHLQRVTQEAPTSPEAAAARLPIADFLFDARRPAEALSLFEAVAAEKDPARKLYAEFMLAHVRYNLKQYDRAADLFQGVLEAIKADPPGAELYRTAALGGLTLAFSRLEGGERLARAYFRGAGGGGGGAATVVRQLRVMGRLQEALTHLDAAARLYQDLLTDGSTSRSPDQFIGVLEEAVSLERRRGNVEGIVALADSIMSSAAGAGAALPTPARLHVLGQKGKALLELGRPEGRAVLNAVATTWDGLPAPDALSTGGAALARVALLDAELATLKHWTPDAAAQSERQVQASVDMLRARERTLRQGYEEVEKLGAPRWAAEAQCRQVEVLAVVAGHIMALAGRPPPELAVSAHPAWRERLKQLAAPGLSVARERLTAVERGPLDESLQLAVQAAQKALASAPSR